MSQLHNSLAVPRVSLNVATGVCVAIGDSDTVAAAGGGAGCPALDLGFPAIIIRYGEHATKATHVGEGELLRGGNE